MGLWYQANLLPLKTISISDRHTAQFELRAKSLNKDDGIGGHLQFELSYGTVSPIVLLDIQKVLWFLKAKEVGVSQNRWAVIIFPGKECPEQNKLISFSEEQ